MMIADWWLIKNDEWWMMNDDEWWLMLSRRADADADTDVNADADDKKVSIWEDELMLMLIYI